MGAIELMVVGDNWRFHLMMWRDLWMNWMMRRMLMDEVRDHRPPRDYPHRVGLLPVLQGEHHQQHGSRRVVANHNFFGILCRKRCTHRVYGPCEWEDGFLNSNADWNSWHKLDTCVETPPYEEFCVPPKFDSGKNLCHIHRIWTVSPYCECTYKRIIYVNSSH